MPACEKCWSDSRDEALISQRDQIQIYHRLVRERDCTPEEQAGPDAHQCRFCGRMSVHQYARVCVICGQEAKAK